MEQIYNEKMNAVGFDQFVCDIFLRWEDVKDEILLPERKSGSGNGTIHVFLGAANSILEKEFKTYYDAVKNGEDTSVKAVTVKHFFLKSNIISMLGYLCKYCKEKDEDFSLIVKEILSEMEAEVAENDMIYSKSYFKLSIGSSRLRPYFKQFDSNGAFHNIIRKLLLPRSAYKIALYKNTRNEYATFWLIGFDSLENFEADSNSKYIEEPIKIEEKHHPLQQIYYGAPGTGKSHEIDTITKAYDTIRTTFHPDSDYSTFVGAYKPTMEEVDVQIVPVAVAGGITLDTNKGTYREKRITYKFVKQAFLKAYLAAWKKYAEGGEDSVQPQFLVIEEINRGNCAQIFGDLFQLLDRQDNGFSSYPIEADADLQREIAEAFAEEGGEYQLPEGTLALDGAVENYKGKLADDIRSGRILLLPNNLYIWATMNTSDQSLFPIDSAFKRRWDWKYIKIAKPKDRRTGEEIAYKIMCGDETCDWWTFISEINKKIAAETSSDDKKLGFFFCKPAKEGEPISAERFVSKVMFYLWNDVFKDGDTKDFDVCGEGTATFEAFYNDDNTVNVENVRKFLVNVVGEENMVTSDDDNEEYPETRASEDDHIHDDWTETEKKRYQYWDALLKYAPEKSEEFAKYFGGVKTPSRDHWKSFSVSDVDFHLAVLQQRKKRALEMEVCFDETTEEYHKLYSNKAEIEAEMGVAYQWQELPNKKSSYISEYKSNVDLDNEEAWPEQFDFIIDRLLRMRAVFSKYAKM